MNVRPEFVGMSDTAQPFKTTRAHHLLMRLRGRAFREFISAAELAVDSPNSSHVDEAAARWRSFETVARVEVTAAVEAWVSTVRPDLAEPYEPTKPA
jgi:hypothetical protein